MPRATSIQIYLKAGLEDDDRLLALWVACKEYSRPQDVFRRLLMRGMDEFIAEGEFSGRILEHMEQIAGKGSAEPTKVRTKEPQREVTPVPHTPDHSPHQHVHSAPPASESKPVAEDILHDTPAPADADPAEFEIELDDLNIEASDAELKQIYDTSDIPKGDIPDTDPEIEESAQEETDGGSEKKDKYAFIGDIM